MRLAKLCITLILALGGWHGALASALCARRADCHAPAARTAGRETRSRTTAHAAADHTQATIRANPDPANRHGHCGSSAESPREVNHAAPADAENETAHDGGGEQNGSSDSVADLRAPDPSCEHCVGRQTRQSTRVKSAAPGHTRDSQATPVPIRHLVTHAPRGPRFAPTEHSPPRGRPLHLLNSVLLI